jgi:hypothetical protein
MSKFIEDLHKEHNDKVDAEVLEKVNIFFSSGDDIGVSLIQRKCRCGYFSASRVLQKLIDEGKVKEGKTSSSICTFL